MSAVEKIGGRLPTVGHDPDHRRPTPSVDPINVDGCHVALTRLWVTSSVLPFLEQIDGEEPAAAWYAASMEIRHR
jgi:hypothetical protein